MNRHTLFTPKLRGGLGAPDLTKYYYAAQLKQLIGFHSKWVNTLWTQLESTHLPSTPISLLMWLKARDIPAYYVRRCLFPWDFGTGWPKDTDSNKGFLHHMDIWEDRAMMSRSTLQEKYLLPTGELFRYSQITHFLNSLKCTSDILNPNRIFV